MPSPVITLRGYAETDYLTPEPYLYSSADYAYGTQATLLRTKKVGFQATLVIYNITQLRILSEFASRGTPALLGNNWTTTSQASGDFLPRNVNTDIEEQVFRSAIPSVTLTCDTGLSQGTTIDTLSFRNHNLTTEASITLQGSKDNFATIDVSIPIVSETQHLYYIAPVFPTGTANQNRYWRFVIDDPTNPDGYIEIGCILFGNARIFSKKESFINPIKHGDIHFVDGLPTEGFTSSNNDRALKKYMSLSFQDLDRSLGNIRIIERVLQLYRTSQKVLVIPRPSKPSRYAVFGKLRDMPELTETDVSNDDDATSDTAYVSLDLTWDEAR